MQSRINTALFLITALAACTATADPVNYTNYKLLRVEPTSQKELLAITQLGESLECQPGPGPQLFAMPADAIPALDDLNIKYEIRADNLQTLIDAARRENDAARTERGTSFFTAYHTYDEINAYMASLVALRPDLATPIVVGATLEGRQIRGLKISSGGANKPAVLISAMQHAREWVAGATGTFVADQLIRQEGIDPTITSLVANVDWYVVPMCNPDGYIYSWTTNRLWRKNRRNNGTSFGVDLNRNWAFGWGGAGSSGSGSEETYRGPQPFSEPESETFSTFIAGIPNLKAHIDLHSYSQLVLSPWGWTEDTSPRRSEIAPLELAMRNAITGTFGTPYTAGPAAQTLYLADGVMPDWTFGARGALGFTYELRDTGVNGFELPPAQILPTATEAFNGIKVLGQFAQLKLTVDLAEPSGLPESEVVPVNVTITPFNNYTIAPDSAKLLYRIGSVGAFAEVPLTGTAPNFSASLPPFECGQSIEIFAQAQASDGTLVTDPPSGVVTLDVINLDTILDDAIETDTGWVINPSGTDTATTGRWERADPTATAAQPADDHTTAGTICWVTDGRAGAGIGTYDIDNGRTSIATPVFDMSAYPAATASFWLWFDNDNNGTNTSDPFLIDVSNNAGASWTNARTIGPSGPGTGGGWLYYEIPVQNFVTLTNQIRLRFTVADNTPAEIVEAALDDFKIVGLADCVPPPGCAGDTNADSAVDGADLSVLLSGFGSTVTPGSPGDLNNDGNIDGADLSVLLSAFGSTCT